MQWREDIMFEWQENWFRKIGKLVLVSKYCFSVPGCSALRIPRVFLFPVKYPYLYKNTMLMIF